MATFNTAIIYIYIYICILQISHICHHTFDVNVFCNVQSNIQNNIKNIQEKMPSHICSHPLFKMPLS